MIGILLVPGSVSATTFDLIAPSGELTRGQDVRFTINIDSEGKSLSSSVIGMTYETQYLEYVSATPGNTFTTVSASNQGSGKIVITGSSASSFSGSGVFAYVTFKLVATGKSSTQLCALFNPSSTTPTSTSAPLPTATPGGPTVTPGGPTSPPLPTALPKTGESSSAVQAIILASLFFVVAAGGFIAFKKT